MKILQALNPIKFYKDPTTPKSSEIRSKTLRIACSWESSSGVESGMSGSGSSSSSSSFSPYGGLADDNLFLWDDAQHLDANLFQANLGDYFGGERG